MKKLSIIIPVYNEQDTLEEILAKLKKLDLGEIKKELIAVDDGSSDDSLEILKRHEEVLTLRHEKNRGKGAAVKTALKYVSGELVIIQDADLEYDPQDIKLCIAPILEAKAKVVYGSRELKRSEKRYSNILFLIGGLLITWTTNLLYGSRLTDEPTCYKTFAKEVLDKLTIEHDGFEWEAEVTAKILKKGVRIEEVPIAYSPRKIGKKIKYSDGFKAIWTLLRYRFSNT